MGATFCAMVGLLVGLAWLRRPRWGSRKVVYEHLVGVHCPGYCIEPVRGDFFSVMENPSERVRGTWVEEVRPGPRERFAPCEGLLPDLREVPGLVELFGKTSR